MGDILDRKRHPSTVLDNIAFDYGLLFFLEKREYTYEAT